MAFDQLLFEILLRVIRVEDAGLPVKMDVNFIL